MDRSFDSYSSRINSDYGTNNPSGGAPPTSPQEKYFGSFGKGLTSSPQTYYPLSPSSVTISVPISGASLSSSYIQRPSPFGGNSSPVRDEVYRRTYIPSHNVPSYDVNYYTQEGRGRSMSESSSIGKPQSPSSAYRETQSRSLSSSGRRLSTSSNDSERIREFSRTSGSLLVSKVDGRVLADFDSQAYSDYKILSRAFRAWVLATFMWRRERRRLEISKQKEIAEHVELLNQRRLAKAFMAFREGCRISRSEKESLILALEHWSLNLCRKVLLAWYNTILDKPLPEMPSPLVVRAVLRWIVTVFPSEGAWWRPNSTGLAHFVPFALTYFHRTSGQLSLVENGLVARLDALGTPALWRLAPPLPRLERLEGCVAAADAHRLRCIFSGWRRWASRVRELRARCDRRRLAEFYAEWKQISAREKKIRSMESARNSRILQKALKQLREVTAQQRARRMDEALAAAQLRQNARRRLFSSWRTCATVSRQCRKAAAVAKWLSFARRAALASDLHAALEKTRRGSPQRYLWELWMRYYRFPTVEPEFAHVRDSALLCAPAQRVDALAHSLEAHSPLEILVRLFVHLHSLKPAQTTVNSRYEESSSSLTQKLSFSPVLRSRTWTGLSPSAPLQEGEADSPGEVCTRSRLTRERRGRIVQNSILSIVKQQEVLRARVQEIFSAWRTQAAARARAVRAHRARREKALLQRCLNGWRQRLAESAEIRARAHEFAQQRLRTHAQAMLRAWFSETRRAHALRDALDSISLQKQQQRQRDAFAAWIAFVHRQREKKRIYAAACAAVRAQRLLRLLQAWRGHARAVRHDRRRLLRMTVDGWRREMRSAHAREAAARAHLELRNSRSKRAAMDLWVAFRNRRQAARWHFTNLARLRDFADLRIGLRRWHSIAHQESELQRKAQERDAYARSELMARVFFAWRRTARQRRCARALSAQAALLRRARALAGAVQLWRAWAARARTVRIISEELASRLSAAETRSLLKTTFDAWRQRSRARARTKAAALEVEMRVRAREQSAALARMQWHARALAASRRSLLQRTFAAWRQFTAVSLRQKEAAEAMLHASRRILLSRYLRRWQERASFIASSDKSDQEFLARLATYSGVPVHELRRMQVQSPPFADALELVVVHHPADQALASGRNTRFLKAEVMKELKRVNAVSFYPFGAYPVDSSTSHNSSRSRHDHTFNKSGNEDERAYRMYVWSMLRLRFSRGALCKWRAGGLSAAFQTWLAHVRNRRVSHARNAVANGMRVRRALAAWRAHTAASLEERLAEARRNRLADARYAHSQVVRALRSWRSVVAARARVRDVGDRVRASLRRAQAQDALLTWLSHVRAARARRQRLALFMREREDRRRRQVLHALAAYVERKRAARGQIQAHMHTVTLRAALPLLRHWRSETARRKRLSELSSSLSVKLRSSRRSNVLHQWIAASLAQQHARNMQQAAEQHDRRRLLTQVMRQWALFRRARQQMKRAIDLGRTATLAVVIARWRATSRELTQQQRALAEARGHYVAVLMRKTLLEWKRRSDEKKNLRDRIVQAQLRLGVLRVEQGVARWREEVRQRRLRRAAFTALAVLRTQHALRRWRLRTRLTSFRNKLKRERELRSKALVLAHWRRERCAHAAARFRRGCLEKSAREAVEQWRERTRLHRRSAAAQAAMQARSARGAVFLWRQWAAARREARRARDEAVQRLRMRISRKIFSAWKSFASDSRQFRIKVLRAQALRVALERRHEKRRLATLAVLFSTWKKRVEVTKRARALADRFQRGFRMRQLFEAWRAHAARKHELRLREAALRRRLVVRQLQRTCAAVGTFARLLLFRRERQRRLLSSVLAAWRAQAAAAALQQAHAVRLMEQRRLASAARRFVRLLREKTRESQRLQRLQRFAAGRLAALRLRRAVRAWRARGAVSVSAKEKIARADQFYRSRLKSRIFALWRAAAGPASRGPKGLFLRAIGSVVPSPSDRGSGVRDENKKIAEVEEKLDESTRFSASVRSAQHFAEWRSSENTASVREQDSFSSRRTPLLARTAPVVSSDTVATATSTRASQGGVTVIAGGNAVVLNGSPSDTDIRRIMETLAGPLSSSPFSRTQPTLFPSNDAVESSLVIDSNGALGSQPLNVSLDAPLIPGHVYSYSTRAANTRTSPTAKDIPLPSNNSSPSTAVNVLEESAIVPPTGPADSVVEVVSFVNDAQEFLNMVVDETLPNSSTLSHSHTRLHPQPQSFNDYSDQRHVLSVSHVIPPEHPTQLAESHTGHELFAHSVFTEHSESSPLARNGTSSSLQDRRSIQSSSEDEIDSNKVLQQARVDRRRAAASVRNLNARARARSLANLASSGSSEISMPLSTRDSPRNLQNSSTPDSHVNHIGSSPNSDSLRSNAYNTTYGPSYLNTYYDSGVVTPVFAEVRVRSPRRRNSTVSLAAEAQHRNLSESATNQLDSSGRRPSQLSSAFSKRILNTYK